MAPLPTGPCPDQVLAVTCLAQAGFGTFGLCFQIPESCQTLGFRSEKVKSLRTLRGSPRHTVYSWLSTSCTLLFGCEGPECETVNQFAVTGSPKLQRSSLKHGGGRTNALCRETVRRPRRRCLPDADPWCQKAQSRCQGTTTCNTERGCYECAVLKSYSHVKLQSPESMLAPHSVLCVVTSTPEPGPLR